MKLERGDTELLGRTRIGMLALNAARSPLVNPAAFHFSSGSLWMTTSRYATKLALARRDPRAAFLVENGGEALLLQGLLDAFDPLSVGGQVRAALEGPAFYMSLAGYAVKNAGFVGGYLLDLARIPREWWPQNRMVLRLRPDRARRFGPLPNVGGAAARVPSTPARVARSLARVATSYLCWFSAGSPILVPAQWAAEEGSEALLAWLPSRLPAPAAAGRPGALVIESHHRYRATRMLGACLRGTVGAAPEAAPAIRERYGLTELGEGKGVRLEPARVTWWQGFEVATRAVDVGSLANGSSPAPAPPPGT